MSLKNGFNHVFIITIPYIILFMIMFFSVLLVTAPSHLIGIIMDHQKNQGTKPKNARDFLEPQGQGPVLESRIPLLQKRFVF